MAIIASHGNMCAIQGESAHVVVERDILPVFWRMTGSTISAKLTIVLVILLVAGITICGRALINASLVATLAG